MLFSQVMWFYLATVAGSSLITAGSLVGRMKTLAKNGYKFDENKLEIYKYKLMKQMLFPIANITYSLLNIKNSLYYKFASKNEDVFKDKKIYRKLYDNELEFVQSNPSLLDLIQFNLGEEIVSTIEYLDENDKMNKINYVNEGILVVKDCKGPIKNKSRLEQRATLISLLEQIKEDEEYEKSMDNLEELLESADEDTKLEIWLSADLSKEEEALLLNDFKEQLRGKIDLETLDIELVYENPDEENKEPMLEIDGSVMEKQKVLNKNKRN